MPKLRKEKTVHPAPHYEGHFADGTVWRMSIYQPLGRPWDFERGRRIISTGHYTGGRQLVDGYFFDMRAEASATPIADPYFIGQPRFYRHAVMGHGEPKRAKRTSAAELRQVLKAVLDGDRAAVERARALLAA